jgi:hypothetical protein
MASRFVTLSFLAALSHGLKCTRTRISIYQIISSQSFSSMIQLIPIMDTRVRFKPSSQKAIDIRGYQDQQSAFDLNLAQTLDTYVQFGADDSQSAQTEGNPSV